MQRKTVIFIADSLDNAHKFQQVLSKLDVDVAAGSSAQFKKLLAASLVFLRHCTIVRPKNIEYFCS